MAMFTGYFEVSVNFNQENRREKFIILISVQYPIYSILIRSQNLLCSIGELWMSFLSINSDYEKQILHFQYGFGGRGN